MERMRKKPGPRGWTGGSFGRVRERCLGSRINLSSDRGEDTVGRSNYLSLSFCLIPFVKGGSHPELCAQRTDEGEGFLCVTRKGTRSEGLECSFLCLSLSYISHGDESCKARTIHSRGFIRGSWCPTERLYI
jgi:hypothetical protein